ncbi:MAG TPA: Ger(x)C family spore germination protein [Firmicutes bacterium]|nr:Ger(x)C family spore germination protein [Bacillota bacterium]
MVRRAAMHSRAAMHRPGVRLLVLCSLVFLLLVTLSGCWDVAEIDHRAFITSVGVDMAGDDKVEVIARSPIPRSVAGGGTMGGGGGGGPTFVLYSAKGSTVAQAMGALGEVTDKSIDLGHLREIIIGEELARRGVGQILDDIFRTSLADATAIILVSKGKARDLMGISPPVEVFPVAYVERYLHKDGLDVATSARVEVWNAYSMAWTPSRELFLPRIIGFRGKPPKGGQGGGGGDGGGQGGAKTPQSPKSQDRLVISGFGIFRDNKLVGWLERNDATAFVWTMGLGKGGYVVVDISDKVPGKKATIMMTYVRVAKRVRKEGDNYRISLAFKVTGNLQGTEGTHLVVKGRRGHEIHKLIKERTEKKIELMVKSMIHKLQRDLKTDAVSFGELVRRAYPREWSAKAWDDIFPGVKVDVKVSASITELNVLH